MLSVKTDRYAPGAPAWVWEIPDSILDDGAKLTLLILWSKADHRDQRIPCETSVWSPAREGMTPTEALHADLAEARGCSLRKVRRHLTKLKQLGLAIPSGRVVALLPPSEALTVNGQTSPDTVTPRPSTVDRQRSKPDRQRSKPDRKRSEPDRQRANQLTPPIPPITPQEPPTQIPAQFSLSIEDSSPATRDLPCEVFEFLRSSVIAAKVDLGIKPATGPMKLSASQRKWFADRIRENGGGDQGVEACRRVIAVDDLECRVNGPSAKSWAYWNATTPFRNQSNFDSRLDRWREDGNHVLWNKPKILPAGYGAAASHKRSVENAERDGMIVTGTNGEFE